MGEVVPAPEESVAAVLMRLVCDDVLCICPSFAGLFFPLTWAGAGGEEQGVMMGGSDVLCICLSFAGLFFPLMWAGAGGEKRGVTMGGGVREARDDGSGE